MAKPKFKIVPVSSGPTIESSRRTSSRVLIIFAFAAVYLIWGSTYLAIRYAIETFPPFLMAATRFLVAGTVLFLWSIPRGDKINVPLSQWLRAFILGGLLLLCGNGGVTWAEKYVASGLAALLVATEPLWVVLLNWVITRKRPNTKVLLGLGVGLGGVALLVSGELTGSGSDSLMSLIGAGVVVAAGFAWASGSVYSNRHPIKASTSMASAMQMLAGGLLLLLVSVFSGDVHKLDLSRASAVSIAALTYLIVFGSLVAFTAYSWLLGNVTPARATTYAYVNPVVAVFLGWLIANEPLTPRVLMGAAVIVGSVVLITTYGADRTTIATTSDIHSTDCPPHPCA